MKPAEAGEKTLSRTTTDKNSIHRIGSLEGQNLIEADYDIDECNGEIVEMFRVRANENIVYRQRESSSDHCTGDCGDVCVYGGGGVL